MTVASVGLPLLGKQLPTIPPNASHEEQISIINDIINKLNNNTQEVVKSATVQFGITGAATQVLTVAHNLGYKPRVFAYLNSVTITLGTGTYAHVDIPLPTYLSSNIPGGGGGPGALPIAFYTWLDCFVDATNVYFVHRSGDPTIILTLPITYYLTRQATN